MAFSPEEADFNTFVMSLAALGAESAALGNVRTIIGLVGFIVKKAQEAKSFRGECLQPRRPMWWTRSGWRVDEFKQGEWLQKRRAVLSLPRPGPLFNAGSDASFHLQRLLQVRRK